MNSWLYLILLVLAFFSSSSLSANNYPPTNPICDSTPYPSFCATTLSDNNSSNVYDYCRVSFHKSISAAREFSSLINYYLTRSSQTLSVTTIRALEDCSFLAEQNIDFLSSSMQTVDTTQTTLDTSEAEDVQTMVSAILTNTQTCWDGLTVSASDWSESNAVYSPLANDTKSYSVSLALFTKAWVPKEKKLPSAGRRKHINFQHGKKLPFKMSRRNKAIYETVGKRKLLQDLDPDQVQVNEIVIVHQNGTGNFPTIKDAVAAAPNNTNASGGYFVIYVTAGVYEEYVSIPSNKRYLMMIGDGINQTIITGSHSVVDGWTTFNSFSFAVVGKGFVAVDITFRNTAGPEKHQAVAVRNGADMSTFYSCSFEGYQDTLYAHSNRQFYRECDIYGTVDFIFGNAAAVFQNCNIYPRLPSSGQFNAITAQGRTDPNQITGYSFQNCSIKAADDLAMSNGNTQTYLGRPWKEYSRTVYMQNFMDSLINPLGWHDWSGDFALNTSYYAEFNNWGPGSNTSGRVKWAGFHVINSKDARSFTVSNFILGDAWLPQSGVPYTGGLM